MIFIQPEVIHNQEDATEQFNETIDGFAHGEEVREYLESGDLEAFTEERPWTISRPLFFNRRRK